MIRIARRNIDLECHAWSQHAEHFTVLSSKSFRLGKQGWAVAEGDAIPTFVLQPNALVKQAVGTV